MHKIVVSLYKVVIKDKIMKFYDAVDPKSPGEKIAAALLQIESRFGIFLTIHDCHGILFHSDGTPFLPGRNMHQHPYCITGRYERDGWNRQCHEECALKVESTATYAKRPFLHHCWKGCTELVVPIERNDSLMLLIYAGVFRKADCAFPEFLPKSLKSCYESLPCEDEELFHDLANILQFFGQGIRHFLDCSRNREGAPTEFREQVRRFVDDRAHEPVSLAELAKELNLSKTRVCHLVKYHFGCSLQNLLLEERMTRARNLLSSTDLPLKAIASAVGFNNEFYFNRIFSRECGVSPGKFRTNNINEQ